MVAICVFGALSALISLMLELRFLVDMLALGTLNAYSIVSACVVILRYQPGEKARLISPPPVYATLDFSSPTTPKPTSFTDVSCEDGAVPNSTKPSTNEKLREYLDSLCSDTGGTPKVFRTGCLWVGGFSDSIVKNHFNFITSIVHLCNL